MTSILIELLSDWSGMWRLPSTAALILEQGANVTKHDLRRAAARDSSIDYDSEGAIDGLLEHGGIPAAETMRTKFSDLDDVDLDAWDERLALEYENEEQRVEDRLIHTRRRAAQLQLSTQSLTEWEELLEAAESSFELDALLTSWSNEIEGIEKETKSKLDSRFAHELDSLSEQQRLVFVECLDAEAYDIAEFVLDNPMPPLHGAGLTITRSYRWPYIATPSVCLDWFINDDGAEIPNGFDRWAAGTDSKHHVALFRQLKALLSAEGIESSIVALDLVTSLHYIFGCFAIDVRRPVEITNGIATVPIRPLEDLRVPQLAVCRSDLVLVVRPVGSSSDDEATSEPLTLRSGSLSMTVRLNTIFGLVGENPAARLTGMLRDLANQIPAKAYFPSSKALDLQVDGTEADNLALAWLEGCGYDRSPAWIGVLRYWTGGDANLVMELLRFLALDCSTLPVLSADLLRSIGETASQIVVSRIQHAFQHQDDRAAIQLVIELAGGPGGEVDAGEARDYINEMHAQILTEADVEALMGQLGRFGLFSKTGGTYQLVDGGIGRILTDAAESSALLGDQT